MHLRRVHLSSSIATCLLAMLYAGTFGGVLNDALAQSQQQNGVNVSSMTVSGSGGEEALRVERQGPEQIRAGQPFEYQIVVTNTSDNPVRQVVVREKHPSNMGIEQSEPQRSEESSPEENIWQLGTIASGESKTIQVRVTPPAEGQMQTCLTVDFKPALCSQVSVVKPDLQLERQVVGDDGQPRDQFLACEDVFLQYRLTNVGSGRTQETEITEELNDVLQTADGENTIAVTADPLEAGETYEQRIPLRIADQQTGRYEGAATAKTGDLTARSSKSTIQIVQPKLDLTLSGPQREFLDRPLTYHVHVENTGDGPALDTQVAMQIPDDAERLTFSGSNVQREGETFLLGRIDPGESRDFSFTFNMSEPTDLSAQATAQALCAEAAQAQMNTQIAGIPAIRLEVVDLQDPVQVGEETTYEIRVKNQGSAEDVNVQVQGELPPSMQFVDARGDTDVKSQGQRLQFGSIDKLAPGEIVSWYIQAKANEAGKVNFKLELTSDASKGGVSEQEPTTLY
jgi:uncharacterized repeat protein (TIGR01451 family)